MNFANIKGLLGRGLRKEPAGTVAADRRLEDEWRRGLKTALYAFVLSRLLILFAMGIAFGYAEHRVDPQRPTETVRIFSPAFFEKLSGVVLQGDAGWYLGVAERGYEKRAFDTTQGANWAFFPLHPKLWRAVIRLGFAPPLAGVLLCNALFFAALVQIWRWVRRILDEDAATRAVLCVALWPTSYIFSLPHTESLYLFLLASSLLAMQNGRWGWAALFAGLCSGTRVTGIFLTPLLWWQSRNSLHLRKRIALAGLATFGLLAFMWILWRKCGDPLAFVHIQPAWGRANGNMLGSLQRFVADPLLIAEPWNSVWISIASIAVALGATLWLWRNGQVSLALFTLASVLLPWQSGSLMGIPRYMSVCVPIFLALAAGLKRPSRYLEWLLASACLLVAMSAAFMMGESFAMT